MSHRQLDSLIFVGGLRMSTRSERSPQSGLFERVFDRLPRLINQLFISLGMGLSYLDIKTQFFAYRVPLFCSVTAITDPILTPSVLEPDGKLIKRCLLKPRLKPLNV